MLIIILFILFVGGGWLIGKVIGKKLFKDNYQENPNITINNYTTEQHLHILKNDLKELTNKSNSI